MHLQTGARGYLLKEMDADALIEAVRVVADGGSYLHPKVTHNLVNEYRKLTAGRAGGGGAFVPTLNSPSTSSANTPRM